MINQRASALLLAVLAGAIGGFVSARFSGSYAKEATSSLLTNEIIVPREGLIFKTLDGKPMAKLVSIQIANAQRNTLSIFNETGARAVELNAFSRGGDISVYDNTNKGSAVSIFATPTGGQLTLMGTLKSALQLSSGEEGGLIVINESGGLPVVTMEAKDHQGRVEVKENGGPEPRLLWRAP